MDSAHDRRSALEDITSERTGEDDREPLWDQPLGQSVGQAAGSPRSL